MSYADFIRALLAIGPKLPQVMALIQHIVSDVQELVEIIKGPATFGDDDTDIDFILTDVEQALETNLVIALADNGETFAAIGDGQLLRRLYTFIKENPQLLQLILSLIK